MRALALALAAALSLACSRAEDVRAKERLRAGPAGAQAARFDWDQPARALELSADEVAARLGSFDWTGSIEWTVSREGEDARRVHAVEHHRVRQLATGQFEVRADVDPGLGPGSETGKEVVFTDGLTYARARHAPFRARPTDRGRDARRFREDSFLSPRALARLIGPRLELRPDRETEVLRRPARRFAVSLARGDVPAQAAAPASSGKVDDDTARRLAFLRGLRAQSATGELVLDAASGAPLRVRVSAAFTIDGEPGARASVELLAQVKTIGGEVAAITAPPGALRDERKAQGVAAALEAAGLKKRADEKKDERTPSEPPEEAGDE